MQYKYKNRKEDLKLLISLGENYEAGTRFRFVFSSGRSGNNYVCELNKNSEYIHCVMADATHVLCLLDNHNLSIGCLEVELYLWLKDSQMPDGSLRLVSKDLVRSVDASGNTFGIMLTNGVSDTLPISQATADLLGVVLKGQDADISGCNTAIANANAVKAAMEALAQEVSTQEASRQANENQRIISENSRRDAEQRREAAAKSQHDAMVAMSNAFSSNMQAISQAEQQSQANENARKSAEAARVDNETTRQSNEANRQSAETSRQTNEENREGAEVTRIENETARQEAETERKALAEELDNINIDFESNNLVITRRDGNTISLNVKGSDGVDGKGGLSFVLDRQNIYLKLDSNGNLASRNKTTFKLTAYIGGVPANILKELDINTSGCSPSPFEAPVESVTPSSTISAFVMFNDSTIYSISDNAKISLTIYYLEGTDTKTVTMNLPIIAVKDGAQGLQGIQGEKGEDADIEAAEAATDAANAAAELANAAAENASQLSGQVSDLAQKSNTLKSALLLLEPILKKAVYTDDENAAIDAYKAAIDAIDFGGGGGGTTKPATPVITLSGASATITCATSGATIYYTTNGNTPTSSSSQYSSAVTLTNGQTIKAIAIKDGVSSNVSSATYSQSVTYYTISKNLSNCSISNNSTQIASGSAYSATISANSGYDLQSVTCTMGGASVSVSNGVISIASVSGNIVINATAQAQSVPDTPSGDYITFADDNVRQLLVTSQLNTDGDSQISKDEAEAATSFRISSNNSASVFASSAITSFNEFNQFTGFSSVQASAFFKCGSLTSITFPNGITSIGASAFQETTSLNLTSLPSGVTSVGDLAFYKSGVALTSLPSSLVTIGNNAFSGTNIAITEIPSSVTSIGKSAFSGCKNINVSSVNGITEIQLSLFNGCAGMTKEFDLSNVTSIGKSAFIGTKIPTFIMPNTPPTATDGIDVDFWIKSTFKVSSEAVRSAYLADAVWGAMTNASTRIIVA